MYASTIGRIVREAIADSAVRLRPDVLAALREAAAAERSDRGREVLGQLIENARIAEEDGVPVCQDTGTVWVWLELGCEECLEGDLQHEIDLAVSEVYREAGLRMSVARDALLDRSNTGDNTPAFVDVTMRPGNGATVHVMLKGGGSDNSSAIGMLDPSAGTDGVRRFVLETVEARATGACPPVIVGVGVGGTFDKVGLLAKRALLRPLSVPSHDARLAEFEAEMLAEINALGIGPGGLGGDTTALAVHAVTGPCHIAALPVAVNMGCCAMRSVSVDVD